MRRDARAYRTDARDAAALIRQFVQGKTLADYLADPMLRSAVERQFEIIGEALNQLAKTVPTLAERIPDLRCMVDFRNVLAHTYAIVDDALVWQAAQHNLPALAQAVATLLVELSDDSRE
jgi:uncharacterized protein with HEPN domain